MVAEKRMKNKKRKKDDKKKKKKGGRQLIDADSLLEGKSNITMHLSFG